MSTACRGPGKSVYYERQIFHTTLSLPESHKFNRILYRRCSSAAFIVVIFHIDATFLRMYAAELWSSQSRMVAARFGQIFMSVFSEKFSLNSASRLQRNCTVLPHLPGDVLQRRTITCVAQLSVIINPLGKPFKHLLIPFKCNKSHPPRTLTSQLPTARLRFGTSLVAEQPRQRGLCR